MFCFTLSTKVESTHATPPSSAAADTTNASLGEQKSVMGSVSANQASLPNAHGEPHVALPDSNGTGANEPGDGGKPEGDGSTDSGGSAGDRKGDAKLSQRRRKSTGSSDETASGGEGGGVGAGKGAQKQNRGACMAAVSAVLKQLHMRVLSREEMMMLDKVIISVTAYELRKSVMRKSADRGSHGKSITALLQLWQMCFRVYFCPPGSSLLFFFSCISRLATAVP